MLCKTGYKYELKMGYVGAVWPVDGFHYLTLYLNIVLWTSLSLFNYALVMKFLHQDGLLSLVKKNKTISLLSFSAYISFQLSCLLLGLNWRGMKKVRECLLILGSVK